MPSLTSPVPASPAWHEFDGRIAAARGTTPSKIPVIVGGDGCGRTTALRRVVARLGPAEAQHLDLERLTATPERCLALITSGSPFRLPDSRGQQPGPQAAFAAVLAVLDQARTHSGATATFLLDEFLELKTFEHFPGLRRVLAEALERIVASPNHFVLTSRFVARTLRLLEHVPDRVVVMTTPELHPADVAADLERVPGCGGAVADEFAHTIVALAAGRAGYARAIVDALAATPSLGDPVSSLVACLVPGGPLDRMCRYSYEYRLQRARGYGALKGILGILAADEPLTLTEIAVQLARTPGSSRDYLWWLEDVDLVVSHRKQYMFADPLLRLWVSLFERSAAPSEEDVAAAAQRYMLSRLAAPAAVTAP
jgi:hypothetical protein